MMMLFLISILLLMLLTNLFVSNDFEYPATLDSLYNANDSQSFSGDTHSVPSVHINYSNGTVIKGYIADSENAVAQVIGGEAVTVEAPMMASFS